MELSDGEHRLVVPEPLHCHHADVVAYIRGLEISNTRFQQDVKALKIEIEQIKLWIEQDEKDSRWFYSVRTDLEDIVASKRWVSLTRRVVVFAAGALVGALMAWETVETWLKTHLK